MFSGLFYPNARPAKAAKPWFIPRIKTPPDAQIIVFANPIEDNM